MDSIDRRSNRLFAQTYVDPLRFGSLDLYQSREGEFRAICRKGLSSTWEVSREAGIWTQCTPKVHGVPSQGFKIHLSASPENADLILNSVLPVLDQAQVSFKVLVDRGVLEFANSQAFPLSACGKFITIYPQDLGQFKRLMRLLHERTQGFEGPYILSDKRYPGSRVLHYRYGAFTNIPSLNVYGEMEPCVLGDDGYLVRDARSAHFGAKWTVEDPYGQAEEAPGEIILNKRYLAKTALARSAKGGVYVCEDLETGRDVVVKEARPYVNGNELNAHGALVYLGNEFDVLKRLEGCDVAPHALDYFQEWEHHFLVMERIHGKPLPNLRGQEGFSLLLKTDYDQQELHQCCYEYLHIVDCLVNAIDAIHRRGVVVNDLAPQNILISEDRKIVHLIDFESAFVDGENGLVVPIGTAGFNEQDLRDGGKPRPEADWHTLSNVVFDLLCPAGLFLGCSFVSDPSDRRAQMMAQMCRQKGIPSSFVSLVSEIAKGAGPARQALEVARESVAFATVPTAHPRPDLSSTALDKALASLVRGVEGEACTDRIDTRPARDYRAFSTNPLSLAFGLSGMAHFLLQARGSVPDALENRLLEEAERITPADYTPSLYLGIGGVAWVLSELGHEHTVETIWQKARHSRLLYQSLDMFHGAAGWGLSNIRLHLKWGKPQYLEEAQRAAQVIKGRLKAHDGAYYFENVDGNIYLGYGHGSSGASLFFAHLFQVTGDADHLATAEALLAFDLARAESRPGQTLVWRRRWSQAPDVMVAPYMKFGNAGVGSVLLRMYQITAKEAYLDQARSAAEYLKGKWSVFTGLFTGMAGLAELQLDMYQVTGESAYLDEAHYFAERMEPYRVGLGNGSLFPGEELIRLSADYGTGAAGVGAFYHRLLNMSGRPFFDLPIDQENHHREAADKKALSGRSASSAWRMA